MRCAVDTWSICIGYMIQFVAAYGTDQKMHPRFVSSRVRRACA